MSWDGRASDLAYAAITGTGQSVANNASELVAFGTVEESTPATFGDLVGEQLVVPAPGVYAFDGYLEYPANATGRREMTLRINGTAIKTHRLHVVTALTACLSITVESIRVAAGDLVTLTTLQTSGAAMTAGTHRLTGLRLSL